MATDLSPRDRSLRRSVFLFPVLFWLVVAALLTGCGGGDQGLDEPIELPLCETIKQVGLQNPPCRVPICETVQQAALQKPPCRIRQPGDL
jgi:hypothetical protein